ncbi:MAG: DEAD/DEAH box helicase [bacterium]|nr:DEAD/DEAH box helicase [bacterium]
MSAHLAFAHAPVRSWFDATFGRPTAAQERSWPHIASGRSVLLLAPTGSGKTLAAFLAALDRLMFAPPPPRDASTRVVYVSPLKALGVDVERNLRAPLVGVGAAARREGVDCRAPSIGVRSGDTSPADRARMLREPPEILITTPESLYLMLTSRAAEALRAVETVIVDEIHTMVGSKRGVHLFLSLERLERLRRADEPLQRIGLSATQRPLDEVARLLGGGVAEGERVIPRPVEIVDAGHGKTLELTVEVPVADMTRLDEQPASDEGPTADATRRSIWPSIHPRLLELVRAHRSTMIFVNSRRLAERLAAALNDLAEDEIALAHHGSVARDTRLAIEDRLKRGELPAIVATSSLELGIDMGAVDLVIQIEAPPSIASGVQRVGRAGHHVGERSKGVVFPKFRGDLLACAAATARMLKGEVEETFYPRNPLDVAAQQIVAVVARESIAVDELFDLLRGAAPFFDLPRRSFEGVLDMLTGRYPSDRFAQLRPRITWDRIAGVLHPRSGTQRVAIVNGGTIPDRGLYGVFLGGDDNERSVRVGELDEEMVFEARPGEVFLLGASSWRIEEITHDRVLVSPAPGEHSKMPFWRGDRPGRPLAFGREIGRLARELCETERADAIARLADQHGLDEFASTNLVGYLEDQREASVVPTDRTLVLERFVDEVGDWRVTLLTPFGGRVHAPWATAVLSRFREQRDIEVDAMWSDDGIVFRLPEVDEPPEDELFFPRSNEVERLVVRQLANTPLFGARFRENAARALLLPRKRPGERTPLWIQRRRSADLLAVAADFPDFPIVLETYRDCLRDVFDLPGLVSILEDVEAGRARVSSLSVPVPSPFAASLLYAYVASYLYEDDAPLAERRAQALSLDHAQLRELLGEPELRELLDPEAIEAVEHRLQRLGESYAARDADGFHDLLLALGDLNREELTRRAAVSSSAGEWIDALLRAGRIYELRLARETRYAAAEDAGTFRDALGIAPPPGLPDAFLELRDGALDRLLERFARTHGPFAAERVAARFAIGVDPIREGLGRLASRGRLLDGEFLPDGTGEEWCDPQSLRSIKQRSLARLRKQVEPVEPAALARFLVEWQTADRPQRGQDALARAVEQLMGAALPASDLERRILPARIDAYDPMLLDSMCAAGEIVWRGAGTLGARDGRIALYTREHFATLAPDVEQPKTDAARRILELLQRGGAQFFDELLAQIGGFPQEALDALWELVWSGHATNDTLAPLRARFGSAARARPRALSTRNRARRGGPPGSEGRWSLLRRDPGPTPTVRRAALVGQLLERHGVLTREAVKAEGSPGGFAAVYPVLKAMEESGRVRRGYFVAGLGATQFALPGAEGRLRGHADTTAEDERRTLRLAATDPANPYGAALSWPDGAGPRPQRAAGCDVVLRDGRLVGFIGRSGEQVTTFLPESEPERGVAARELVRVLSLPLDRGERRAVMFTAVDGLAPRDSVLAAELERAGFAARRGAYLKRRSRA